MQVGAIYPQIETADDPRALKSIGLAVEELGYDHLLFYDHVVGADRSNREPPLVGGPYTETDPFREPLVAIAYLAGLTERLGFFTGILILPQRQTVLVAKQAADIDLLSGGRLTLGVGTGWNYVEYDALGASFADRGRVLDEQIPYLRRLWSESRLTYEGKFHKIDRGNLIPLPSRQIPIFLGGGTDVAFRRAVRTGDGFIFGGLVQDHAIPGWQRCQELLREAGRSTDGFGSHYLVMDQKNSGLAPDVAVEAALRWRDAGGTQISVCTMGLGLKSADAHLDYLAEFKRKLAA